MKITSWFRISVIAVGIFAALTMPPQAFAINYRVTAVLCDGEHTFTAVDNKYILDSAEEAGIDLPYSDRAGTSLTSLAVLVSGTVDQSDQNALTEEQVARGFMLLDVAYPRSDVRMQICGALDSLNGGNPPVCP
jgi:ferredoxin